MITSVITRAKTTADSIRVTPSPRLTGEVRALTGEDSVRFNF